MSEPIKLPKINGIEYERLDEERLCSCGRIMDVGSLTIRRNMRGQIFKEILPAKHGICLNCAADAISQKSVDEYERILTQIKAYEDLEERKEITDDQLKIKYALKLNIQNLREFVSELSKFVEYSEEHPPEYVNPEESVNE